MTDLQDQFGQLGGYDWQAQGDKILEGLGFTTDMLQKPLKEFSGGWRMRAMKDVVGYDKPRGAAKQALIRGFPNGETCP